MQISKNKVVSLAYQLEVDGEIVDQAGTENPLQFIFGVGMLLPKFEENIENKKVGEKFEFRLSPSEGYGEVNESAILEFPIDMFMVDGKPEEGLLVEGNVIPMQDRDGNILNGTLVELKDNAVVLDFNHPLAGMDLHFTGSIVEIREATEKELEKGHTCGCGNDGDCEEHDHVHDHGKGGCGCCCH
jgi:FKBP-type peptidyl-prolyl cis-trans isomerase SlyD